MVTTTTTTSPSTAAAFVVTTRRPLEENIVITDPVGRAAASLLGRKGMLTEKLILKKKPFTNETTVSTLEVLAYWIS